MTIGLGATGLVAYFVSHNETMMRTIFGNPMLLFGLIIGELALVFFLSARVHKLQASTATSLFLLYSILNGVTLSFIFIVYTSSSITSTFFVCAATFLACSIYGMVTKRDLTSLGGFMFMGLIGIIIASVVNMFIGSHGIHMIISYLGVFIFIGHTPNTQLFEGQLEMDNAGYLVVNNYIETKIPGVYAAGEVADPHFRQVITSAGMGSASAIQATRYLETLE